MGLPSLSEDVLERWLNDAFLQLQRRPAPDLLKLIHRELSPRFLELYTSARCAERDLNEARKHLADQNAAVQAMKEELAKSQKELRALTHHVQELEAKLLTATKSAAEDALHLDQLRRRLAAKEAAETSAKAAAAKSKHDVDHLMRLCREKEQRLQSQEKELTFLRKAAMQNLFGKNA